MAVCLRESQMSRQRVRKVSRQGEGHLELRRFGHAAAEGCMNLRAAATMEIPPPHIVILTLTLTRGTANVARLQTTTIAKFPIFEPYAPTVISTPP